jgi:putative transposase
MPVPAMPGAGLAMIEAGLVLCPQEAFIDRPTQTESCREFITRGLCWREGGVVGNAPGSWRLLRASIQRSDPYTASARTKRQGMPSSRRPAIIPCAIVGLVAKQIESPRKHGALPGPEYISGKLLIWALRRRITIQHIQPGQPQQNTYIKRYNRTVRHEWLDQYIIETIEVAQDFATQWLWTYNNDRPNMGIGGITPAQKLKMAA